MNVEMKGSKLFKEGKSSYLNFKIVSIDGRNFQEKHAAKNNRLLNRTVTR